MYIIIHDTDIIFLSPCATVNIFFLQYINNIIAFMCVL